MRTKMNQDQRKLWDTLISCVPPEEADRILGRLKAASLAAMEDLCALVEASSPPSRVLRSAPYIVRDGLTEQVGIVLGDHAHVIYEREEGA